MKRLRVILFFKQKDQSEKFLEEWIIEPDKKYLIGRNPEKTNITISEGTISRIHAELEYSKDEQLTIKDLGSANGTYVNGTQIPANESHNVSIGGKISLGESKKYLIIKDPQDSDKIKPKEEKAANMEKEDRTKNEEKEREKSSSSSSEKKRRRRKSADLHKEKEKEHQKERERKAPGHEREHKKIKKSESDSSSRSRKKKSRSRSRKRQDHRVNNEMSKIPHQKNETKIQPPIVTKPSNQEKISAQTEQNENIKPNPTRDLSRTAYETATNFQKEKENEKEREREREREISLLQKKLFEEFLQTKEIEEKAIKSKLPKLRENDNFYKQSGTIFDPEEKEYISRMESKTTNLEARFQIGGLVHEKEDFSRFNKDFRDNRDGWESRRSNFEDNIRYNNNSSYRKRSYENDEGYFHSNSSATYIPPRKLYPTEYPNNRGVRRTYHNNWKRGGYY